MQIHYLCALVASLPEPNRATFAFLFLFLSDLCGNAEVNMMSAENLGTCMGPNIVFEKGAEAGDLFRSFDRITKMMTVLLDNVGFVLKPGHTPLKTYKALSSFTPTQPGELSIPQNAVVHVFLRDEKKTKAYGEVDGNFGWFPHRIIKDKNKKRKKKNTLSTETLPQGFNPSRPELYLTEEEFRARVGVGKADFLKLPTWKQEQLKEKAGLTAPKTSRF